MIFLKERELTNGGIQDNVWEKKNKNLSLAMTYDQLLVEIVNGLGYWIQNNKTFKTLSHSDYFSWKRSPIGQSNLLVNKEKILEFPL
jgi:hypothetical protein